MVAAPHIKHQNNVHKCVRWSAKKVSHHLNVSLIKALITP
jgi:hypothetical protein